MRRGSRQENRYEIKKGVIELVKILEAKGLVNITSMEVKLMPRSMIASFCRIYSSIFSEFFFLRTDVKISVVGQ
ncbi:MAG: hypothetical protein QW325_02300 [Nitrososphaerota archaeon]